MHHLRDLQSTRDVSDCIRPLVLTAVPFSCLCTISSHRKISCACIYGMSSDKFCSTLLVDILYRALEVFSVQITLCPFPKRSFLLLAPSSIPYQCLPLFPLSSFRTTHMYACILLRMHCHSLLLSSTGCALSFCTVLTRHIHLVFCVVD